MPPQDVGPPHHPGWTPPPQETIKYLFWHPPGAIPLIKLPTTRVEAEGSGTGTALSWGGLFDMAPDNNGLPGGPYALLVRLVGTEGRAGLLPMIRGKSSINKAGK